MQSKARITIRFDTPQPARRPPAAASGLPEIPANDAPAPVRSSGFPGGPLQDDPSMLEEIIRRAEWIEMPLPPDAAPVASSPSFSPSPGAIDEPAWEMPAVGPEHDPIPHTVSPSGYRSTFTGPSWWRVFASVGGAIATGALFGYLVLTLFTGDNPFPDKPVSGSDSPGQAAAESGDAGAAPQATAPPSGDSKDAGKEASTSLSPETYYLLQYGVFHSAESMNAAVEELKSKGLPAAADSSDGYRVYAGAAAGKEEARLLAAQMPGIEVFIKAATLDSATATAADGSSAMSLFVRRSHELARRLAGLSIAALQDPQPQPIDAAQFAALRESHRRWLEAKDAVGRVTGAAGESAHAMAQALDTAMISVDDYGRKMSRFHLWAVQSNIVEVIMADRTLRSALVSVSRS